MTTPRPGGYYKFLETHARYRQRATLVIADALARELFDGNDMDNIDLLSQAAMNRAAEHALVSITHSGIELMFGAEGQFRGVVT